MTTSLSPQRTFSNKSTLIGIAVPTPTRKDGTPIPLADTPPEGFQKVRVPRSDAPSAIDSRIELPRSQQPPPVATPSINQQVIAATKAAANPADPTKVDASTRVTRRDLPVHGASRPSIPVSGPPATSTSSNPPANAASSSRWLMIGVAVAALVLGGRWLYMQTRGSEGENPPPSGVQVVPPAPAPPQATPPDSATAVAPSGATPPASAAPDAKTPTESDSAAPAPSAALPAGTRVVIVTISPPQARLFRKGKPIGSSPVRIELAPDEKRRSFEVGAPGWRTRRLVVDGTKPEVFIGLKPEPGR
jgi:hypothetical protein